MTSKETKSAEKVNLIKCDQLCIKALIPEPPENQPSLTMKEIMNEAMHWQARDSLGYKRIEKFCYVSNPLCKSGNLDECIVGAMIPHKDYVLDSEMGRMLLREVLETNQKSSWVVDDRRVSGGQIRYPKDDASLLEAKVVGGYVLDYMVKLHTQNVEGDVYVKIPQSGKYLKDGVILKYMLVSVYPYLDNSGYGNVEMRVITFEVDRAIISSRTIVREVDLQMYMEKEPEINVQEPTFTSPTYDDGPDLERG